MSPRGPLRLLYVADPSSIHTKRWLHHFMARGCEVGLAFPAATAQGWSTHQGFALSPTSRVPGGRLARNVFELRAAIRSFEPDVLHAHYINEAGWLAAASGFRPYVLTAWGSDIYVAPRTSRLARFLNPVAVRRADWLTADSADQVRALVEMGAAYGRTTVVNWGVDVAAAASTDRASAKAELGIPPDTDVVFSPRRWVSNSNIDLVVDAFAELCRTRARPPVLLLKESGHPEPEIRRRIESLLGLPEVRQRVRMVGEVSEAALLRLYAASDVTVSYCTSDGTPVSVLEAMACGSCVVAAELPSVGEWIVHGVTGLMVRQGSVDDLAAALKRLLDDSGLRHDLARTARLAVTRRADRGEQFAIMEGIYRDLVKK